MAITTGGLYVDRPRSSGSALNDDIESAYLIAGIVATVIVGMAAIGAHPGNGGGDGYSTAALSRETAFSSGVPSIWQKQHRHQRGRCSRDVLGIVVGGSLIG